MVYLLSLLVILNVKCFLCYFKFVYLLFFFNSPRVPQQEVENFKKLNMISKDEFDTLTPKVPVDPNQEVPPPPMSGGFVELTQAEHPVCCFNHSYVS